MITFKYFRTVTLENFYCITQEILKYFFNVENLLDIIVVDKHAQQLYSSKVVFVGDSEYNLKEWNFIYNLQKKFLLHIEYVDINKKKKKVNQWIYEGEQHKMIILSACSSSKIFMLKLMPAQKINYNRISTYTF